MALKGVKVIEFAGLAPAPFCGMILADFGADVIRVNKINDRGTLDRLANGKKSIAVNLKDTKGVQIMKELCKESDVLIEPFRAGVMEKNGLGPEILLRDNPNLIYARLTGYGQKGLYKNSAGHDINYVGLSGLLSLFGRKDEKPTFPVNVVADFGGGGLMCALGILMALFERSRSGRGQVVDCSMVEGTAYLGSWLYRSQNLPIWGQQRGENVLDSGAHFYDVYRTKDEKFVTVGALEEQFYMKLLQGLGLNEDDAPQFGQFDEMKKIFEEKFLQKTQKEWCEIFDGIDACVGPLLDLKDAPNHPHNVESFVDTEEGKFPKPAPVLSRTPAESQCLKKSPDCGEHTREILETLLGYGADEIDQLEVQGIVQSRSKSKL
ncbi:alpha-methylacyl-CoA racemase [Aethina tumida]|uniref:alpha-methylacyl-CoA racemase n=1 Tax=Aethina tumida TaxID=116153 RepID=UPI0021493E32|nr:alpha-methylacyl-CoA racemase [Aethina tumida]